MMCKRVLDGQRNGQDLPLRIDDDAAVNTSGKLKKKVLHSPVGDKSQVWKNFGLKKNKEKADKTFAVVNQDTQVVPQTFQKATRC